MNAEVGSESNTKVEVAPEAVAEAEVVGASVEAGAGALAREGAALPVVASFEDVNGRHSTCRNMRLDGRAPSSSAPPTRDACHAAAWSLALRGERGAGAGDLSAPRARFLAPKGRSLPAAAVVLIDIGRMPLPLIGS